MNRECFKLFDVADATPKSPPGFGEKLSALPQRLQISVLPGGIKVLIIRSCQIRWDCLIYNDCGW